MKKLFLLFTLLLITNFASAQNRCNNLFEINQESILGKLAIHNIAYYIIKVGQKDVPVILVNNETYETVKSIFDGTVGFQVMSKQGWPNDHGSFRYGNYIIDAFLAGQRQVGEIHQTGLSWKNTRDSATFLDKIADIIGEAVVPVSKEEMRAIDFYQRVRRAALYRIPFSMGDQAIYNKFDNVITECGGYCFEFSHSLSLTNQKQAIENRLAQLDPNAAVRNQFGAQIKLFIEAAERAVLSSNVFDPASLSEKTLTSNQLSQISSQFLPKEWEQRKKELFLNYIVSAKAIAGMVEFMNASGVSEYNPIQSLQRNRVEALIVWDPTATAESFNSANYQKGAQTFQIPKGVRK